MSHNIRVILAKEEIITKICTQLENAYHLSLDQGFAVIPVTDLLLEELSALISPKKNHDYSDFEMLSNSLHEFLIKISDDAATCYFETNYEGGTGNQSSILYINKQIHGPFYTRTIWDEKSQNLVDIPKDHRAINKVLYNMDVHSKYRDEFGTLGLPKFKNNTEILNAINK